MYQIPPNVPFLKQVTSLCFVSKKCDRKFHFDVVRKKAEKFVNIRIEYFSSGRAKMKLGQGNIKILPVSIQLNQLH